MYAPPIAPQRVDTEPKACLNHRMCRSKGLIPMGHHKNTVSDNKTKDVKRPYQRKAVGSRERQSDRQLPLRSKGRIRRSRRLNPPEELCAPDTTPGV